MFTFWKSRSNRAILSGLFLAVSGILIAKSYFNFPGKGRPLVKPHESTTGFTSPLDANGDVDYNAVLLGRERRAEIDPNENAMVCLLDGIGPTPEGSPLGADFYKRLGAPEPRTAPFDYFYQWKNGFIATSTTEVDPSELDVHFEFANSNPWTPEQAPSIDAYLVDMKPAMVHFDEAIEKTQYYCPLVQPDPTGPIISTLLPIVQKLRHIAKLYCMLAMQNIAEGDHESALVNAMKIRKLAKLMAQSPTAVEQLVTTAIENIAIDVEQKVISQNVLSAEKIETYLDSIEDFTNVADTTFCYQVTERVMFLDLAKCIGRGETTFSELRSDWGMPATNGTELQETLAAGATDWEQVMRRINHWYDEILNAKELATTTEQLARLEELRAEVEPPSGSILNSRRARADKFFSYFIDPFGGVSAINCEKAFARAKVRNAQTRIMNALLTFKNNSSEYPESLDELVPEFLQSVPIDEFSNTAMLYRKSDESFLLYSVGPNQVDDDAVSTPEGANYWGEPSGPDDIFVPQDEETLEAFMKRK